MTATDTNPRPATQPCWYYITTTWCVLCGHEDQDRERRHDPRPERWEDRHEDIETACGHHFV
jgi:hypothetical protein